MKHLPYLLLFGLLLSPGLFAADESEDLTIVEKVAQKNLGRDVAFTFRPRMLGMTGIRLDNFRIGENEDYLKRHPYLSPWAFSVESVDVRYNPFAILLGRISLSEVSVRYPQVQIAVNSRLEHNFEDILQKQKTSRFSNWIRAHHINIDNMHFNIYSELMFAQPVKYEVEDIDVDIKNVIKGKVATVDVAAKTPGASQQNVTARGTIGPIVSVARIEESPMNLKFRVENAPLEFELARVPESIFKDRRYRRTLALPESGLANISYNLNGGIWENLDVRGDIKLSDIVFASIDKSLKGKEFDVIVQSNSSISLNKQESIVENISIEINGSKIELNGDIQQIIDNPAVNLHLYSNTINLAEFNKIYPFISDIYKIGLSKGTTQMDLKTSGNLKEGLALNGYFKTSDLQLASLVNGMKGKTLDSSIQLDQPVIYYSRENKAVYDSISLNIANSVINISGSVEEVTSLDRTINAEVSSKALDVSAMHEFAPFVDEYLPDEMSYDGYFSFKAKAQGNLYDGKISGTADLSPLTFRIKNFARKTGKSKFNVNYSADYDDKKGLIIEGSFLLNNGELDNSVIFVNGIRQLLGGDSISQAGLNYLSKINPQAISFGKVSGTLSMEVGSSLTLSSSDEMNVDLVVKNIRNAQQKNVNLTLNGTVNAENYHLDLNGKLQIPKASYQKILEINPGSRKYLNKDGSYMVLPVGIQGSINNPKFKAQG